MSGNNYPHIKRSRFVVPDPSFSWYVRGMAAGIVTGIVMFGGMLWQFQILAVKDHGVKEEDAAALRITDLRSEVTGLLNIALERSRSITVPSVPGTDNGDVPQGADGEGSGVLDP